MNFERSERIVADEQPALVLLLSNEAPLYASDLGELFASLADDYERLTEGRQLVLASVRQGSLWAIFHDVAGVFGDANALIGFGKSISAVWQIAREGGPKARSLFRTRKKPGVRVVEKLTKIAVNSRSNVDLRYRGPDGEELILSTSPQEAAPVQEVVTALRARPRPAEIAVKTAPIEVAPRQIEDLRGLTDLAKRISDSKQVGDGEASELEAILAALLKQLMEHGQQHLAEAMAADLEQQGHAEAANLIRQLLAGGASSSRGRNPPLTT